MRGEGDADRRLDSARIHSSQAGLTPSSSPFAMMSATPTFTAIVWGGRGVLTLGVMNARGVCVHVLP